MVKGDYTVYMLDSQRNHFSVGGSPKRHPFRPCLCQGPCPVIRISLGGPATRGGESPVFRKQVLPVLGLRRSSSVARSTGHGRQHQTNGAQSVGASLGAGRAGFGCGPASSRSKLEVLGAVVTSVGPGSRAGETQAFTFPGGGPQRTADCAGVR